jgi:hypothetical protein
MQRVLGIAQVDAVQIVRHLAFDRGQAVGIPFDRLRPPRAGPVGMVVVLGQRGQELADDFDVHVTVACALHPRP